MPFLSLRRGRAKPPAADEVIDLSEDTDSSQQVDDLAADGAAVPPAGQETIDLTDTEDGQGDDAESGEAPSDAVGTPVAAGGAGAAGDDPEGVHPATDEDAAAVASAERRRRRAERRSRGFAALIGALTLRPDMGRGLTAALAVGVAWLWLTGWVLVASLFVTLAAGFISGGALVRPDAFIDSWRLMNLMPVASISGPVSLVPMLPAMAVFALLVHGSGWLWSHLQRRQEGWVLPAAGVGAMAGGYLLFAVLIATSPTADSVDDPFTQGWLALIAVLIAGIGVTFARRLLRIVYPRTWLLFRAAGTVIALLLAIAFVVLMLLLLSNWSQVWDMSASLLSSGVEPPSRFDAAALGAIQLAYLPNLVIWTASYLVGAGFSVGDDTIVSPFSVSIGTLPELPISTLLPTEPLRWPWLPLALVAAGSLLAGSVIRNAGLARHMRTRLVVGIGVAAIAAVCMGALAAASNGGLGPGRLSMMGPHAGITMLATFLVVGFGQVAWALFPTLMADVGPFAEHARHTVSRMRRKRPSVPKVPTGKSPAAGAPGPQVKARTGLLRRRRRAEQAARR